MISWTLKSAVTSHGPTMVLTANDVSNYSLRADRYMAFLCSVINYDIIKFISCWNSDNMINDLNVQDKPDMYNFPSIMVKHGTYTLILSHEVTCY